MILPLKLFAKQLVIQLCPLLQNVKNLVALLLWDVKRSLTLFLMYVEIRNSRWLHYLDKKGRAADLRDSKVPGDGLAPAPTGGTEPG